MKNKASNRLKGGFALFAALLMSTGPAFAASGAQGGSAHVMPGMANPEMILELAQSADSPNVLNRERALRQLMKWQDDVGAGGVARFLDDQEPKLRHMALDYLGNRESPVSIAYLGSVFEHRDVTMRRDAIAYLGGFSRGDYRAEVAQAVLPFLSDSNSELRVAAVTAVGQTGDPVLLGEVASLYGSKDLELRKAAVASLRNVWRPETVQTLLPFTDDKSPDIRRSSYEGLAQMGGRIGFSVLVEKGLYDESESVRQGVIESVASLRLGAAVPHLVAQFEGAGLDEKRQLISALDDISNEEALEALYNINFSGSTFDQLLVAKVVEENSEKREHEIREMHSVLRSSSGQQAFVKVSKSRNPDYVASAEGRRRR